MATTAHVMLIANLWVKAGLVNGALGTVELWYLHVMKVVLSQNYHWLLWSSLSIFCGPTLPDHTELL